MPEIIACQHCQRKLQLPAELLGREVKCPACGQRFVAEQALPVILVEPAEEASVMLEEASDKDVAEHARAGARSRRRRAQDRASWPERRPTAGPSTQRVLLFVGVILFVAAGIAVTVVASWPRRNRNVLAPVLAQDRQNLRPEVAEVFREQKPLGIDEITREIRPFFDSLGAAFRAQDGNQLGRMFDGARLADELVAAGVIGRDVTRRPGFAAGVQQGIGRSLQQQATLLQWDATEIRNIKQLQGNDAVVIARHRAPDGVTLKMRWWISKRSGTWKIYDMEDLDVGLRVTHAGATLLGGGLAAAQKTAKDFVHLRDALHAMALRRNVAEAERKLKVIAAIRFPGELEALHEMVIGLVHMHRARNKDAVAAFDKAAQIHPDMPGLDLLKAMAFNNLRQYEQALKHITVYKDLLGDDANVCTELGESLLGMGRHAEACVEYRKALDYDPKDMDPFVGLLRALRPGDKKDDLGRRFASLENPGAQFNECMNECKRAGDWQALEIIASAMRQIDAKDVRADSWLALAKIAAGNVKEGVVLFQSALKQQGDPKRKQEYLSLFAQLTARTGKAVEAYAAMPDAREAFRALARELRISYRYDDLRKLVAAHAVKDAMDPLIGLYQGWVHLDDGQYRKADELFSAATGIDKPILDGFAANRVAARYYLGQGLAAYRDIEPKDKTFAQLASYCLQDNNLSLLQELITAHDKLDNDADALRYRLALNIRQGRPDVAIAILQRSGVTIPQDKWTAIIRQFVYEMNDAGRGLEAYGALPDKEEAFTVLARDLLGGGQIDELRKLVSFHEERHGSHPLLRLYKGELHLLDRDWAKAVDVLAEGYGRASDKNRPQYRAAYLEALVKAGKSVEGLDAVAEPNKAFDYLAGALLIDKQHEQLEALLNAYRAKNPDSPDLLFQEARLRLAKQADEAAALFRKAYDAQPVGSRRSHYVREWALDYADQGRGLEGYRASPDRRTAFDVIARAYLNKKQDKELEALLAEHAKEFAQDSRVAVYRGELHLLRREPALAEKHFEGTLSQNSLDRARVLAGKAVQAYRESGGGNRTFEILAQLCVTDKNPDQLEALVRAHRQNNPDYPHVSVWELEIRWLRKDYAGVIELAKVPAKDLPGAARFAWKTKTYLVRSLIKLNRTKEALAELDQDAKTRRANHTLILLAHASTGDVNKTVEIAQRSGPLQRLLRTWYNHDDLGPILRTPEFQPFRDRFPQPPARTLYSREYGNN